jgi:peptidoglycan-associated lipoprotein
MNSLAAESNSRRACNSSGHSSILTRRISAATQAGLYPRRPSSLRSYPQVAIVIEGHGDERGSNEYNLALGDRRANSAKDFLVVQGVAVGGIQTVSYRKERPFCTDSDESCWQLNRRARFGMTETSSSQLNGN